MHMGDCFRAPEKPFTAGLRDWIGIPEPIMACSGTAAFVVALRTLARRNPGRSRVVVPAYTCPLVPLAVRLAGLRAGVRHAARRVWNRSRRARALLR